MITRAEYMNNSELFNEYYGQFILPETRYFIISAIGMEKLLKSKDKHFNDIIKHSNGGAGGWVWDFTPFNLQLARELGEVSKNGTGSMSTHTCVGKVCARRLLAETQNKQGKQ